MGWHIWDLVNNCHIRQQAAYRPRDLVHDQLIDAVHMHKGVGEDDAAQHDVIVLRVPCRQLVKYVLNDVAECLRRRS